MYTYGSGKFSPNGNYYAFGIDGNEIQLFSFDRCTGNLTYVDTFITSVNRQICFLEFSPNSRFLYYCTQTEVHQIDLTNIDPSSTNTVVAQYDGYSDQSDRTYFCKLGLAPDNKIYISTLPLTHYLHVINAPDSSGVDCHLEQHSLQLPCLNVAIPNYPNYSLINSLCDTTNSINNREDFPFTIYPNPASEFLQFTINSRTTKECRLDLYDFSGRFVESSILENQRILLHGLMNGLYFYQIYLENKRYFGKVIIQH
jgi:hypothetical protein